MSATVNLGTLSTTKTDHGAFKIDKTTDKWGITKDSDKYTINLTKGNKYTFEIASTSQYKDAQGTLRYNDINFSLLDSSNKAMNKWTGLTTDTKTIPGTTIISFIANETSTHTLDIFGYAGYETDGFTTNIIDSPYTLKTQDNGPIDKYSNVDTNAHEITITNGEGTISDADIYSSVEDDDWFSFSADSSKDYQVTVKTTDGAYKTIDFDTNVSWSEKHNGKDDDYTKEYYYTPSASGTVKFKVGGGIGDYTVSVKEIVLDADGENKDNATSLTIDGSANSSSLFSARDRDWFKVDGLESNTAYEIVINTVELNSKYSTNDFGIYTYTENDPGSGYNSIGKYGYATTVGGYSGGKKYIFNTGTDVSTHYINLGSYSWHLVTGDYEIQVKKHVDESTGYEGAVTLAQGKDNEQSSIFHNGDDVDWFKVTLEEGKTYLFHAEGSIGTDLQLFKSDGTTEATHYLKDTSAGKFYNPATNLEYTVESGQGGTYYLKLDAYSDSYKYTTISYDEIVLNADTNSGDTKAEAVIIDQPLTIGAINSVGDEDYYKFELEAGKKYKIDINSESLVQFSRDDGVWDFFYDITKEDDSNNSKLYADYYMNSSLKEMFLGLYKWTGEDKTETLRIISEFDAATYNSNIQKAKIAVGEEGSLTANELRDFKYEMAMLDGWDSSIGGGTYGFKAFDLSAKDSYNAINFYAGTYRQWNKDGVESSITWGDGTNSVTLATGDVANNANIDTVIQALADKINNDATLGASYTATADTDHNNLLIKKSDGSAFTSTVSQNNYSGLSTYIKVFNDGTSNGGYISDYLYVSDEETHGSTEYYTTFYGVDHFTDSSIILKDSAFNISAPENNVPFDILISKLKEISSNYGTANETVTKTSYETFVDDNFGSDNVIDKHLYSVAESGTYILKLANENPSEWEEGLGNYEIEFVEIGGDIAGNTADSAKDFREFDKEDITEVSSNPLVTESQAKEAEDGKVTSYLESRSDKDWFKYDFEAGNIYKISLAEHNQDIRIYDDLGNRIAARYGDNTLTQVFGDGFGRSYKFTPQSEGTYYIEVSDAGYRYSSSKEYNLTVTNMSADDKIGSSTDGAYNYTDILALSDEQKKDYMKLDFFQDKDWIKIDTKTGSNYTIELDAVTVDSKTMKYLNLNIFDRNGEQVHLESTLEVLEESEGAKYKPTITIDWDSDKAAAINLFTTDTVYYVQVDNYSETGYYTLNVTENTDKDDYGSGVDNHGDFAQIDRLDGNLDNTISGKLEKRNDRDWFKVQFEEGVAYKIVFDSATVDGGYINVKNMWGSSWYAGDLTPDFAADLATSKTTDNHYIFTAKYSGTHYINIENKYGAGDYTLQVERMAQDTFDGSIKTASEVVLNGTTEVSVEDSLLNNKDHDMKKLTLEAGKTYQFEISATGDAKTQLGQMSIILKSLTNDNIVDGVMREWMPSGDTVSRLAFTPSESGTYYIDISSAKGGVGAYTFKAKELVMENDIGSTVNTAGVFTTLDTDNDGTITSEINPNFDQDWIKYSFEADKSYKISLNSDTSDTGLVYIYDEAGKLLQANQIWDTTNSFGSADRNIIFNAKESKDYYLVVADNKTNTYTLDVAEFTDTNDFSADVSTSGTVTTDGTKTESSITPANDKDWIKVALTADTVYKINLNQKADKTALPLELAIGGIYDASGNIIANTTVVDNQLIFKATTTANHFIEVYALNDTIGVYEISVSGISTTERTTISAATDTTAVMATNTDGTFKTYNSAIDYYGDKDWIKVTLKGGTKYDINLTGVNLTNAVIGGIYDASGNLVSDTYNDNASAHTLDAKTTFTTSGTTSDNVVYFIEATGKDGATGSYKLDVALNDGTTDTAASETAGSDVNNTTSTAITDNGLKKYIYGEINHGSDTDYYEYNFEKGVTYEINMYGASTDTGSLDNTYIKSIRDSSGVEISNSSNARGGQGNDSYLKFTASESGKYYIETASLYDDTGSFRLRVKEETSNLGGSNSTSNGSHTIMVYLAGDNNLERYMLEDLIEMQLGTLPDNWNVTFLIDRAEGFDTSYGNWTDTRQGIITFADADTEKEAQYDILSSMESLGELNTGDGETLTNFINWSVKNAQADSYSLILSNHGGGITGSAWDDTNGHDNLKIDELTKSIEASLAFKEQAENNKKAFEMIGFDTCLQGVLDQQYALKDVTDVILASEEVSWSDYWDYEAWFDGIKALDDSNGADGVDGADMASIYVDLMKDYDEAGGTSGRDMTYSSVDATKLETLVTKIKDLNTSLQTISADDQQAIKNSISSVVTFGDQALIDVGAFAKLIDSMDIGGTDGQGVDQKAKDVLSAVNSAVLKNYTNMEGSSGDEAMGISMYFNGGYESSQYMDNFELASLMNMHDFYEVV